jgi:hypothetical protein
MAKIWAPPFAARILQETANFMFSAGVLRMPHIRRVWTEDDIAKLKSMAGQIPREEIAAQLGRTAAATAMVASKLGISLRRPAGTPQPAVMHAERSGQHNIDHALPVFLGTISGLE